MNSVNNQLFQSFESQKSWLVYSNLTQLCLLQSQLADEQARQNNFIWRSENFLSFNQFLKKLLDIFVEQTGEIRYFVITPTQLKHLAELVISSEIQTSNSITLSTSVNLKEPVIASSQFLTARKIKAHYFLKLDELNSATLSQKLFNRINQLFNQKLTKNDYLDEVLLIQLLLKKFNPSWLENYQIELYLSQLSPLEKKLIDKLNLKRSYQANSKKQIGKASQKQKVYVLNQKQDEVQFALRKIKIYQKQYPNKKVVLAVAQTPQYQSLLEQFADKNPKKISLVQRKNQLIQYKVFNDALTIIQLLIQKSIDLNQLLASFQSISFLHQLFNQSHFLDRLVQTKSQSIDIGSFIELIGSLDKPLAKELSLVEQKFKLGQKNSFLNFSKVIANLLLALKWQVSDETHLTDCAQSNRENWQYLHQILDELTTLDLIYKNKVNANSFFDCFETILSKTTSHNPFYLNSILIAPIHDLIDLSNFGFDAIWILGLDENYPSTQPTQSLLNFKEQREKIETCNPKITFEQSLNQLNFYLNHSEIIAMSYAKYQEDVSYQMSELIDKLDLKTKSNLEIEPIEDCQLNEKNSKQSTSHHFSEDKIKDNLQFFQKASVSQLDRFNQCNFLSFAEKILMDSNHQEEIETKPTAREKGILVHQMIENFFKKVPNQQIFLKLNQTHQLDEIINQSIDDALKKVKQYSISYQETERQYLVDLMQKFKQDINQGNDSKNFEVLSNEELIQTDLDNFLLNARIDRIEKLNNQIALVDVKTSNKGHHNESIQLLFYAWMIEKNKTKQVGNQRFNQLVKEPITQLNYQSFYFEKAKPKINNSFKELNQPETYFSYIESFIKYFQSGELLIRYDKKLCERCQYRPLCRIDESRHYFE